MFNYANMYFYTVIIFSVCLPIIWTNNLFFEKNLDTEISILKRKIKQSQEDLKELEMLALNTIKHTINDQQWEQRKTIKEYQKKMNDLKYVRHRNQPLASNMIKTNCINYENQETKKLMLKGNLQQCYPKKDIFNYLKQIKRRIQKLEKLATQILKSCRNSVQHIKVEICAHQKVTKIYQQIFYVKRDYISELKKLINNSNNCAKKINSGVHKRLNGILLQTKACVGKTF
uniref:Uncharacterized protein LOC114337130 n=1 Tax=Diabrotica virgifera virgifera TaxID=50390 RepID=A0A6P7GEF7_DIAVI